MQFLLIDLGATFAVLLGYLAFSALSGSSRASRTRE
jgi:hypothetical protein